jgi:hypothetical protein
MITLIAPPESIQRIARDGRERWVTVFHCSDWVTRNMAQLKKVCGLSDTTINKHLRSMPFDSPNLLVKKVRKSYAPKLSKDVGNAAWDRLGSATRPENFRNVNPLGSFELGAA